MRKMLLTFVTAALWLLPCSAQPKKRVAVMNFDYATVQSNVSAMFGANQDIGKGIADLIVNQLVAGGVYSVVERKALDKVLAEQNFSNSDRADPNTAAKIAKILGVDVIIVGSITQFGKDDKTTSVSGNAIGGIAGRYGIGGVGKRDAKAIVGLSARVVSTDTAEILAVAQGKGESKRSGATLLGSGGSAVNAAGGAFDMTSKNFGDTLIGEAVTQAVTQLTARINQESARVPQRTLNIDGLVADVSGGTLVLNVGSRAGLKVGDRLKVMRVGRSITDPATGKVLRRVEDQVGEVVISDVDEQSAGGKFTGSGAAKVGDHVKP